ncbi:3264_t:CDS:2 [Entrophospora sp. SA101]|nr:3264_t:CDS:2 [Entrophospora sp. SA101]
MFKNGTKSIGNLIYRTGPEGPVYGGHFSKSLNLACFLFIQLQRPEVHDTNENNSITDNNLIQETGIFLLAAHKGSYDLGENNIHGK